MDESNERERDAERSAPHRERTSERIAGAREIPHTEEQAERARRGVRSEFRTPAENDAAIARCYEGVRRDLRAARDGGAIAALRRILTLLGSTSTFTVAFDGENKTMFLEDAGEAGARLQKIGEVTRGDSVVTWEELDELRDVLGDLCEPGRLARARIDNTALRAEVDRLRRVAEEAPARLSAELEELKKLNAELCSIDNAELAEALERTRQLTRTLDEAQDALKEADEFEGHVAALLAELAGAEPAWWVKAGRAVVELQRMLNKVPTPADAVEPPPGGKRCAACGNRIDPFGGKHYCDASSAG